MTNISFILLMSVIALLAGAVAVLLWRIHHAQRELRDKNEVIIREVHKNAVLRDELRKSWRMLQNTALATVVLLTIAACSKENEAEPAATDGGTEICIFFAPNELGDHGYADQLLSVLYKLEETLTEAERENLMLHFITESDSIILRRTIQSWNKQNKNPFTRKNYTRRLMVLSDPILLAMFEGSVPDSISEVLVMNASNDLFRQASHHEALGSRMHLLSISAAEAGRKFCRMVEQSENLSPQTQKQIWHLKQFDDLQAMADSIGIVCFEFVTANPENTLLTLPKYTYQKGTITLGDAYKIAHLLPIGDSSSEFSCFTLCGWGKQNVAISSLILTKGLGGTQATFLDTDYPALKGICHSIIRHYDRALLDWLQRWLKARPGTMPVQEWHGAWDGYVTDDL